MSKLTRNLKTRNKIVIYKLVKESEICTKYSTGVVVGIMKNIYNKYNSSKSSTVDPPRSRQRIGVREIDFVI